MSILNFWRKRSNKPRRTIWLAFLYGNLYAWADRREDLNLRVYSPSDPRLEIKQFVEVTGDSAASLKARKPG